jgi:hypothetical protein
VPHASQTGFSTRALGGLFGTDNWQIKVSPDVSTLYDAMIANWASGLVRFPMGLTLDVTCTPVLPRS